MVASCKPPATVIDWGAKQVPTSNPVPWLSPSISRNYKFKSLLVERQNDEISTFNQELWLAHWTGISVCSQLNKAIKLKVISIMGSTSRKKNEISLSRNDWGSKVMAKKKKQFVHLYRKLNVHGRLEAVNKVNELLMSKK